MSRSSGQDLPAKTPAQKVLVTAGAAGIGRAIAERFLADGAQVHVCDVSERALAALSESEPAISWSRCDVADRHDVKAMFIDLDERFGRLDVLVNNAGVGGPRGPVDDLDEDDWDRTIAVNLNGMFYVTKHAARMMKRQGSGVIINISTASVRTGLPYRLAYIASKQGVMGFSKNLARELGPHGIRCNAILPGPIDNPRGRSLIQRTADEQGKSVGDVEASVLRYISMRSWIDPSEIGDMAVFLASPAARHVTGQFIGVDGGAEWEE